MDNTNDRVYNTIMFHGDWIVVSDSNNKLETKMLFLDNIFKLDFYDSKYDGKGAFITTAIEQIEVKLTNETYEEFYKHFDSFEKRHSNVKNIENKTYEGTYTTPSTLQ